MLHGFREFYDGLHSHIASEMSHALHEHGDETNHTPSFFELAAELFAPLSGLRAFPAESNSGHDGHLSVGSPHGDGFTSQTHPYSCAVVSQKMILDRFGVRDPHTGHPVTEEELIYTGNLHCWFDHDNKTPEFNIGKLLEHYGVSCHRGTGWDRLIQELSQGHEVIVSVNGNELWTDHGIFGNLSHLFDNAPNHALVLKGLKTDEDRHVTVVVNDPGQIDGAGVEYSLEQFEQALSGEHFHFVATDHAPPGFRADHADGSSWGGAANDLGSHDSHDAPSDHLDHHSPLHDIYDFAAVIDQMTVAEKHEFLRSI